MTPTEAMVAISVALFAVGGPVSLLINARFAKKPEVTVVEAEKTVIKQLTKELEPDNRWRQYADELEDRLREEIDALRATLSKTRKSLDRVITYAEILRNHIAQGHKPPPPPWPDEID